MPRETNCSATKSRASATPCLSAELARQRELHLAGELRVFALLRRLKTLTQQSCHEPPLRMI